ncbi:MAG TPA: DUF4159 domain-containing protein [Gemmatimonadaceae bacterium]|nr:DUF4159 domain-containing protein [Gemmatimonadaceae bacterium]
MRRSLLVLVLVTAVALPLAAQRFGRSAYIPPNQPYDGQFTIVRLWYGGHPGWSYDYPDMEQNLTVILRELTSLTPNPQGSNIHAMDDPELFRHPVAYLSEPGYWHPGESEVLGLRAWLAKGGFLIVDDFHFANEWAVFERAIRRVLPDARIDRLTLGHPVFDTFYGIQSLDIPYPGRFGRQGLMGEFYGIHEDNDPDKRLMVVINYNMDIGDYMEHSGSGFYLVDPTNEAFKLGVNYLIYGLTR